MASSDILKRVGNVCSDVKIQVQTSNYGKDDAFANRNLKGSSQTHPNQVQERESAYIPNLEQVSMRPITA